MSPLDIRVAELKVGAEHIPSLIGRKGAQLRDIESINAELDFGPDADGIPAQAAAPAPRLAEDEAQAQDEGETGVTTH